MLDKYKKYKDICILYIATCKGISFKMKAMFSINTSYLDLNNVLMM